MQSHQKALQSYEILILENFARQPFMTARQDRLNIPRAVSDAFPNMGAKKQKLAVKYVSEYRASYFKIKGTLAKISKRPPLKSISAKAKDWLEKARHCHSVHLLNCPYHEFMRSKYWLCIRNAKLADCGSKCEGCANHHFLQVHHLDYVKRGMEHENFGRLVLLCDQCHGKRHGK